MNLSVYDSVVLLGVAQGFFVAFLLFKRNVANQTAANYLISLVSIVSFLLLGRLSYQSEWLQQYGEIIMLPDTALFITGPCIWLFVRNLLRQPKNSTRQLIMHMSPAIFHALVVNTILGQHITGNWQFLTATHILLAYYAIEGLGILSISFYLFKSYQLLNKRDQFKKQGRVAKSALQFLPIFLSVGLVLILCWSISFLFHIFQYDPQYAAYQFFWILLVTYVYWLAYVGVLKTSIFELPRATRQVSSADEVMIKKIKNHFETSQPFLASNLKLADLAQQLQLSSHELSRLINVGFDQSFFDCINTHRIRFFIKHYQPTEKSTILQSAFQAGFNSKSAFNRAFRKVTGKSPSDYFQPNKSTTNKKEVQRA